MIKRTLYFGNPAYLKTANEQLVVETPLPESLKTATEDVKTVAKTIPIEDIGLLILDHRQVTIT
ncbi:MAG: type II CRISPR-associated endonuclease Cas1, partial [Chitinophagaceae bacterium]|nr:type II CRISPR-associated endonuclease Cas1 [Chitinophagaceae bacterium]